MVTLRKFYDEHPINETAILKNLADKGISRNKITRIMSGTMKTTITVCTPPTCWQNNTIKSGMNILDLCSGVGGTTADIWPIAKA